MSDSNLVSVQEMIDLAFGDSEVNVVDFKLIQTILFLLAHKLQVLGRHVEVDIELLGSLSETRRNWSVTEVKMHANVPKKKKGKHRAAVKSKGELHDKNIHGSPAAFDFKDKGKYQTSDKHSYKSGSGSSSDPTESEKSTYKTILENGSTKKYSYKGSKKQADRSSSQDSLSDDERAKKGRLDKKSVRKHSSDKRSTEKRTSHKSGSRESLSDRERSSDIKHRTSIKQSTKKSSEEPSSGPPFGYKKIAHERPSKDIKSVETDTSYAGKHSLDKIYTGIDKSQRPAITSDKQSSLTRIGAFQKKKRADEIQSSSLITTSESNEVRYEKILVVEKEPSEETATRRTHSDDRYTPRLPVVTKEQFNGLIKAVNELQVKFGTVTKPGAEESKLLQSLHKHASLTDAIGGLQLSARLEVAETALQKTQLLINEIASRTPIATELTDLSSAEGSEEISGNVTEMAGGPVGRSGVTSGSHGETSGSPGGTGESLVGILGETLAGEASVIQPAGILRTTNSSLADVVGGTQKSKMEFTSKTRKSPSYSSRKPTGASPRPAPLAGGTSIEAKIVGHDDEPKKSSIYVSYDELDNAMQYLHGTFRKVVANTTSRSMNNATNALNIAKKVEGKIDESVNLGSRINELEVLVTEYTDKINAMDRNLTAQMTEYQDDLSQMQHDLETGLDNMDEAISNLGSDTKVVAELNSYFNTLQDDLNNALVVQKELHDNEEEMSLELLDLWQEIRVIHEVKCDRGELEAALSGKVGIGVINELVSLIQFDAVSGDLEKGIRSAYDKFNNQELIWQRAIDDLIREINTKANTTQVDALHDEVNDNLNMLRSKIDGMFEILDEREPVVIPRTMYRVSKCLSCSTPANMKIEENLRQFKTIPGFSSVRPPTIGAEASTKPSGHLDYGICYPGFPVTHPVDPRSRICRRYCCGPHATPNALSQTQTGVMVTPIIRETSTAISSDAKEHTLTDDMPTQKPCLPCNVLQIKEETSIEELPSAEPAPYFDETCQCASLDILPPSCLDMPDQNF